jgi:hypothetical protein
MGKLLELKNVRGGEEGFPVELWTDDDSGRLVIRAYSEAGYNATDIDFDDLCRWFDGDEAAAYRGVPAELSPEGDQSSALKERRCGTY